MPKKRFVRGTGSPTRKQMMSIRAQLSRDIETIREFEELKTKPKGEWTGEDRKRYAVLKKRSWRSEKRRDAEQGKPVPKSYSGTSSKDRPPRQKPLDHYKKRDKRKAVLTTLDNIAVVERCVVQLVSAATRCERNGFEGDAE